MVATPFIVHRGSSNNRDASIHRYIVAPLIYIYIYIYDDDDDGITPWSKIPKDVTRG